MMLLALLSLLCAGMAQAAGLGRLNVQSRIGQPLAAEIELINAGRDDLSSLKVALASVAAYRAAGLTFDPALNSLRLTLERRANGTPYIRAAGTRRVAEPFIDLLVDLATPDGGIQRAYTVLLDLPDGADSTPSTPASAPMAATPAAKLDATPPPPREPRAAPARKAPAAVVAAAPAPVVATPSRAPLDTRAPAEKPKAEPPKPVVAPVTPPAEPPKAEPPTPAAREFVPPVSAQPAEPATATPPAPSSVSPPAPAAKKAPVPSPQKSQRSTTTENSKSYTTLIVGIALALLAGIGGWWTLAAARRRREAEAGEFIAVEPTVDAIASETAASTNSGKAGAPQTVARAAVPTGATVSNVTDMVDPIDEARVYLEHGQDEPAEKLLREALSQQPGREDMQMLLLEILGKRGDKDGFNQLAGRLHKQTGGAGEHWKHVMAMGYTLDPAYPLYSPAATATTEQPAPSVAAEGIDFDLGLSATGLASSGTATDIDLNSPAQGADGIATDILLDDGKTHNEIDKTLVLQRTGLMPAENAAATPLDIQFDLPPVDASSANVAQGAKEDTAEAKTETEGGGLDFSIDLPTIKPPPAAEAPTIGPAAPAKPRIDPELLEDLLHKIDLARAYREMGDKEAALEELQDVLRDGDEALQTEARELIELLNTPAGTPGSS